LFFRTCPLRARAMTVPGADDGWALSMLPAAFRRSQRGRGRSCVQLLLIVSMTPRTLSQTASCQLMPLATRPHPSEPAMNRSGKPVCEHCRALAGPSVIIAMVPVMAIS
jgi:hypothetical protein